MLEALQGSEPDSASKGLAELVARAGWEEVCGAAHEAKRSILNFFATALGSANDPAVSSIVRVLAQCTGRPSSALIGRAERFDALSAAFVNAVSANLLDYDDTHLRTIIHPTAPVFAPAFSLAESRGASGRDLLLAFILGVEIECRIGNSVSPAHYTRGWHITSTCGVFGAAAASAKLLGLDLQQTAHAIGIAASQSAGLVENLASAAKNVSVGGAARNGLFAALLAEAGCTSAARAIEGPLGWARAMGDEPDLSALKGGLDAGWEISKNTYKPYPAGIVFHAVIDACVELRPELNGGVADIADILVEGSPLLLARGDREVLNERDARVSIHHCVAVALLRGAAGVAEFMPDTVFDPAIMRLRARVTAAIDALLPDAAARVRIRLNSGKVLTKTIMHARGSLENPLSDAELEGKLRESARRNGGKWAVDRIIESVWRLETLQTVAPLIPEEER